MNHEVPVPVSVSNSDTDNSQIQHAHKLHQNAIIIETVCIGILLHYYFGPNIYLPMRRTAFQDLLAKWKI